MFFFWENPPTQGWLEPAMRNEYRRVTRNGNHPFRTTIWTRGRIMLHIPTIYIIANQPDTLPKNHFLGGERR